MKFTTSLIILLACLAINIYAASIRKGPYLLYPGNNTQMTVLWQLDGTQSCTLQWGLDTSYSDGNVATSEYGTDHQHKYTITSLTPASKYYYRLTVGTNQYTGSFLAAPPENAHNVKFMAYGDTRTNTDKLDMVNGKMINTWQNDPNYQTFTLHVGDWVAADDEPNWTNQFFNRSWSNNLQLQANLPTNGCMGNHEQTGTLFVKYWLYPYVADRYWSFDYGPAHIAVVDQYTSYSTGSAQLLWLANDLATTNKEWKFIMLHEPGYSAGGHADSTNVRNYIQPLCQTYGVDIVFGGHNHYYARCDANSIKHITAGAAGAPLYTPNPNYSIYVETCAKLYHFCKINIDHYRLDLETIRADTGATIDSFSLQHFMPADFDKDGDVDMHDLRDFIDQWLGTCTADNWCNGCDFNQDYKVNFIDFATFAECWYLQ